MTDFGHYYKFSQFLFIFVYNLISVLNTTAKIRYVFFSAKTRNLKIYTLIGLSPKLLDILINKRKRTFFKYLVLKTPETYV